MLWADSTIYHCVTLVTGISHARRRGGWLEGGDGQVVLWTRRIFHAVVQIGLLKNGIPLFLWRVQLDSVSDGQRPRK